MSLGQAPGVRVRSQEPRRGAVDDDGQPTGDHRLDDGGGAGHRGAPHFYAKHFLNQLPPDLEVTSLSRTVGTNRVVDELVVKFTHSIQMDWVLPGVPPTGKCIEFAMVVVVYMENGRISAEHLYWDTASMMKQAGLITDPKLPILGAEHARNMVSHTAPLNELIHRTQR